LFAITSECTKDFFAGSTVVRIVTTVARIFGSGAASRGGTFIFA